ncbi:hypothetical protein VTK26DRAFT_1041 [Humicola hyalothermophila]
MGPTNNKAGGLERRVSSRNSVRRSVNTPDEDHDYASAAVVADGFQPAVSANSNRTDTPEPRTPSISSGSSTLLGDDNAGSPPRTGPHSSPLKFHQPPDSLSSHHDSPGLTRRATNSSESTQSTVTFVPVQGPYQGPRGPSHPYHMYPQNVRLARSTSTATSGTSSTLPRSESSYTGPRAPAHPYGLYPQSDGIEAAAVPGVPIPLGFHGLPDQYQRRVGPDGEDTGDIIGPDGHTEQLPPYTRYPEGSYAPKFAVAGGGNPDMGSGAVLAPPPATIRAPPPPIALTIPGAGGIGLATRNPEFESTDDLRSARSRHSARSFTSSNASQRRIRLDDDEINEKGRPPRRWQLWLRRRLWGIVPYWAILLAAVVVVALVPAIVGAVVGTAMDKKERPRKNIAEDDPIFDAIPIPTPPDLPPLPLGSYSVPVGDTRRSKTCFQDPTLSQAWDCRMVVFALQLTVGKARDRYTVTLQGNRSFTLANHVYSYGQQPPLIQDPVKLQLVQDKFEPSRGPAWFALLKYDKTVIVPEDQLGPSADPSAQQKQARSTPSASVASSPGFKRKPIAEPGDKPWICHWPDTYFEIFIYAQQNSSYSNWSRPPSMPSSSRTLSSTLFPSTGLPQEATMTSTTTTPAKGEHQPFPDPTVPPGPGAFPGDLSGDFQNEGYWPPPQNLGSNDEDDTDGHDDFDDDPDVDTSSTPLETPLKTKAPNPITTPSTSVAPTSSSSSTTVTVTVTKDANNSPFGFPDIDSDGDDGTFAGFPPLPPPYPRVVKLEERRVSTEGAPRPRCTQVEVQEGNGVEAEVVRDDKGRPRVIEIEEVESVFAAMEGVGVGVASSEAAGVGPGRLGRLRVRVRRVDGGDGEGSVVWEVPDISPCGCIWFST